MTRWDYAVLDEDNCDLHAMGDAGWELVAVVRWEYDNQREGTVEADQRLYFKRPLLERPNHAAHKTDRLF